MSKKNQATELIDSAIAIAEELVSKVFCATGPGGGRDPSCGRDGGRGRGVGADGDQPAAPIRNAPVMSSKPARERYRDRIEGTQEEADREVRKADKKIAKLEKKMAEVREKFKKADTTVEAFKEFRSALERVEKAHERVAAAKKALDASRKKTARLMAKLGKGKKSPNELDSDIVESIIQEHRRHTMELKKAAKEFGTAVEAAQAF